MSIFEIIMMVCFGAAWPFSIYRSWTSRSVEGKSIVFLVIVQVGYLAGIMHKVFYRWDGVVALYILNLLMVSIDALLYIRNRSLADDNASIDPLSPCAAESKSNT